MTTQRRVGTETSKTRAVLLNHAERLMLDEGYAAVTYRALAAKAGVTSGLVQYYFPTLDDLFVGLVRDRTEKGLKRLVKGLRTGRPLRALWGYVNYRAAAALTAELTALANHRKAIRTEIAQAGERTRELVLSALAERAEEYTFAGQGISPDVLVFLMTSTPRMIVMEEAAGMSKSHAETIAFFERYLDQVEPL